jgi:hypothetical protein
VAAVQHTFTHKQYTEYRERNIQNNKKIENRGPCPVFASYNLAFALQLRKKHGKPSVRVVKKTSVRVVETSVRAVQLQAGSTKRADKNLTN